MTVKQLRERLSKLPDDMPVALNEGLAEATGMVRDVYIVNGHEDAHCPCDKGDGIYQTDLSDAPNTPVCFIST